MIPLFLFFYFVTSVVSWEMSLLHVNDIHARLEETSKYSGPCSVKDKVAGKCFGGIARISSLVKEFKATEKKSIWLNAGDFYQGTVWYSKFKWRPLAQVNNLLDFDAMTLGNHEFDNGLDGLLPFLQNITCPVVVSNLDAKNVEKNFSHLYTSSLILNIGSKKIGLVGYITTDTIHTSSPPKRLVFLDEIEAVSQEVKYLSDKGIDIIIALGHSGYEKDKEIAMKVPGIDVVVGAHSHSFLFSESSDHKNPSNEHIMGPYPTVIENIHGNKVLVVQAYAFTKYLGHLKVNFTEDGTISSWKGTPILLDSSIKEDQSILTALDPWKQELLNVTKKIIGRTNVFLKKSRQEETNLGNMLTDAMVFAYTNKTDENGLRFKVAILNSGGIRSSLSKGNITLGDIMTIFPFESTIDTMILSGKHIKEAFERGVEEFSKDGKNSEGQFLQVSCFRLTIDVRNPVGNRVSKIQIICQNCTEDQYEELQENKLYPIITNSYIANGGDGLISISKNKKNHEIGELDIDVFRHYLRFHPEVQPKTENRIIILSTSGLTASFSPVLPLFFTLLWI